MTDVGRNETVRLDEDDPSDTFATHSAFALMSFDHLEATVPEGHSTRHDHSIKTMPTPFDRTNQDDADRTQDDLMIQLAGAVDDHCLSVVLDDSTVEVTELEVAELDGWIRSAALDIVLDTRDSCGIDLLVDGELTPFISSSVQEGRPFVDVGWTKTNVYEMNRHRAVEKGFYAVLNLQHVISLSARASLFFTSHSLDQATEYLSARCDVAYAPRLDFHPGAVRVARVAFADEAAWRTAARAAALD
ncbi:hypothetical protein GEV29_08105 [Aeromicrobium sp. SMF47]|uniref:hypothetical protein n=1 Tax=Aeromicrobium TaxID=2040 RepID=UPI00129D9611|nr:MULTISPECIES: hypothetical protein [Aeromicrobium]MRJ76494.1 hypothetical protein [Aeromicrobium yanjiei]MRK00845.1 hypothetical protein [Aeromicrobium sp. S22]